jgi:hypothetical protein
MLIESEQMRDMARTMYQAALPQAKHQEAMLFCADSLFKYFASNLRQTPQSLATEGSLPADNQEKYERLISTTLHALSHVIGMEQTNAIMCLCHTAHTKYTC